MRRDSVTTCRVYSRASMSSGCRWPAVEHRVELRVELGLDLGVLGEQVERPRQVGVQVLGAEERLDRAAQVGVGPAQLVVHADPVVQQVVAFEAVATRRPQRVDGRIELAAELVAAPALGRRKPPAQRAQRVHEPSQPGVAGRQGVVDDGALLVERLAGERAPADAVGHAPQVLVGLDRAAVAPLLRPAHRLLDAPSPGSRDRPGSGSTCGRGAGRGPGPSWSPGRLRTST